MNVAVDPDVRRTRRRHRAADRADRARRRPAGALHARGAPVQRRRRSPCTSASASAPPGMRRRYYQDNGEDALIMWRTPATLNGSLDDVPHAGPVHAVGGRDPRDRDELRRHVRRGRHARDGEIRSNVISSQGVHDRYGGVVPEVASRHHLELVNAGRRRRARRAPARRSTTSTSSPSRRARGSSARCSSASRRAKGIAAARGLPLAPVDHLQGHVAANFLAPRAVRAAVPVPDRQRRPHVPRARRGPRRLRGPRPHARRRRRRGVRQGRAAARPAVSRAARRSSASPRTATRARSPSRPPPASPAWTSRSPGSRPRCCTRSATSARTRRARARADLAASYQHAIVEALALRVERALEHDRASTAWRSAAASPPTARCASAWPGSACRCGSRRASCAPTTRR